MPEYRMGIRVETRDDSTRSLENIERGFGDLSDAAEDASRRGASALSDFDREARRLGSGGPLSDVSRQMDRVGQDAEQMGRDGRDAFQTIQREARQVDFSPIEQEIAGAQSALDEFAAGLEGGFNLGDMLGAGAIGGAVGGLLSGAVGAIGEAWGNATEAASNAETATARVRTQLDVTAEEAERFRDVAEDLFSDAYGESVADNIAALVDVERAFRRIGGTENQDQLRRVTEQALAISDAFGYDVPESVGAAVTLMDKFSISSDQAFGFIVAGAQRGLDTSGDFLDTIGEYSNQFANTGATAEEFFSILETGFQGGVLGTDKIADAVKEFNIRIQDGSTTTKTALESIGLDYDTLAQGFADGSITQIDAMQQVIDKINQIEDPIARQIAGVALFGTQWEDLTEDVILEVDTQKTKLSELETSVEDLGAQYETTSSDVQVALNQWQLAITPLANTWNGWVADSISSAATWLQAWQASFATIGDWWNGRDLPSPNVGPNLNPNGAGRPIAPGGGPGAPIGGPDLRPPGAAQQNLAVVNPLNQVPVTFSPSPPPGWVGAWNPQIGTGRPMGTVQINQNFYGQTDPNATKQAALDAARRMGMR